MNLVKIVAVFETTLASGILPSSPSATLQTYTDKKGAALSGLYGFTFDEGEANEEFTVGTIAAGVVTFALRGVDTSDPTVEVAALKKKHRKGSTVKITNYVALAQVVLLANGEKGFPNELRYETAPPLSSNLSIPHKAWVESLSLAAGGITQFLVSDVGGVNVAIGAGLYKVGDVTITYAGSGSTALTNNATNYIELTHLGTLNVSISGFTAGYLPLAEVVTLAGDITSVTDRRTWLTLPHTFRDSSFTYGATIAALDPLYGDAAASNKLKKALATSSATAEVIAIALDAGVDGSTGKRVYLPGAIIDGLAGLTAYAPVFLTDAGGFSSSVGTYRKCVGIARSATSMLFLPVPGIERLAGGNSSVTQAMINEAALALPSLLTPFSGTGADGALTITSGTTTVNLGGASLVVKEYSSISITGTGNLAFSNPHANGTVIILRSKGNVTITTSAARAIDLRNLGGVGGTVSGSAGGNGGPGSDYPYYVDNASHFGAGGSGDGGAGPGIAGVAVTAGTEPHYASLENYILLSRTLRVVPGSGGGAGGNGHGSGTAGAGGRGAGSLIIQCGGAYNCTGTIDASGTAGTGGTPANNNDGGSGGGGAGGMIVVVYNSLTADTGTYTVAGGAGGTGGTLIGGFSPGQGGGGGACLTAGTVGGASGPAVAAGGAGGAGIALRILNKVL